MNIIWKQLSWKASACWRKIDMFLESRLHSMRYVVYITTSREMFWGWLFLFSSEPICVFICPNYFSLLLYALAPFYSEHLVWSYYSKVFDYFKPQRVSIVIFILNVSVLFGFLKQKHESIPFSYFINLFSSILSVFSTTIIVKSDTVHHKYIMSICIHIKLQHWPLNN